MLTLANIFFPTWMLGAIPSYLWLIMLPVNFLIDSLVLLIWAKVKKIQKIGDFWKSSIVRVWCFGFVSDLLAAFILCLFYFGGYALLDWLSLTFIDDLFGQAMIGWGSFLYGLFGALIGGCLIYSLDRRWGFRKTTLSLLQQKSVALWLAILTAPWLLAIPTELLYNNLLA